MDESDKGSSFFAAVENNDVEKVKQMILVDDFDVNISTDFGFTPLHIACSRGHTEIVKALLVRGADPGVSDNSNFEPLHEASREDHLPIVKILVEQYGASVNSASVSKATPLHFACSNGNFELAEFLIKKGADFDAETKWGTTPAKYLTSKKMRRQLRTLWEEGYKDNKNRRGTVFKNDSTSFLPSSKNASIESTNGSVLNGKISDSLSQNLTGNSAASIPTQSQPVILQNPQEIPNAQTKQPSLVSKNASNGIALEKNRSVVSSVGSINSVDTSTSSKPSAVVSPPLPKSSSNASVDNMVEDSSENVPLEELGMEVVVNILRANKLSAFIEKFRADEVDGSMLKDLEADDLDEMQVGTRIQRNKLLRVLKEYKEIGYKLSPADIEAVSLAESTEQQQLQLQQQIKQQQQDQQHVLSAATTPDKSQTNTPESKSPNTAEELSTSAISTPLIVTISNNTSTAPGSSERIVTEGAPSDVALTVSNSSLPLQHRSSSNTSPFISPDSSIVDEKSLSVALGNVPDSTIRIAKLNNVSPPTSPDVPSLHSSDTDVDSAQVLTSDGRVQKQNNLNSLGLRLSKQVVMTTVEPPRLNPNNFFDTNSGFEQTGTAAFNNPLSPTNIHSSDATDSASDVTKSQLPFQQSQ